MVKITIIGWYGTETIGDRAIFAGLLRVFSECFNEYIIKWGSLIPHFTQRTLLEDLNFYQEISNNKLKNVEIFDSLSVSSLKTHIKESDFIAIGGGPLMDIQCMFMLEYAFKYANKHRIPAFMLGCGWGPLNTNKYINSALKIIKYADLAIFRDNDSSKGYFKYGNSKQTYSLIDPAFFAAQYYIQKYPQIRKKNYIAINLRDVRIDTPYVSSDFQFEKLIDFIRQLSINFPEKQIHLIPMHTFYVGGDDRIILENIRKELKSLPVSVQHRPLSLKETMEIYRDASLCIGMRFHSIVLQTIVNGYNYILDYTDPDKGKTIGMIRQLGLESSLSGRYTSIFQPQNLKINEETEQLTISQSVISNYCNTFIQLVKQSYESYPYKHK